MMMIMRLYDDNDYVEPGNLIEHINHDDDDDDDDDDNNDEMTMMWNLAISLGISTSKSLSESEKV